MGLSLQPEHLKRYRDIARLLIKYGRSDLVKHAKLQMALDDGVVVAPAIDPAESRELAADLEAMGPTFIRLGQLLSSRPDLLPSPYIAALSRLQDRVEPFAFAEVERIVAQELGARMSRLFLDFDPEPAAATSLGQVHQATLRDGRLVVVKVQRPGIRGRKITLLSPLALAELDAKPLAEQLFNAYLKQILVDGFFHADPHPGNVFLPEGGRVALLDLGMVGRITPSMQDELLRMVLAISEARGEEVANVTVRTGDPRPSFDEHGYRRSISELVAQYQGGLILVFNIMRHNPKGDAHRRLNRYRTCTLFHPFRSPHEQRTLHLDPGRRLDRLLVPGFGGRACRGRQREAHGGALESSARERARHPRLPATLVRRR